MICKASYILKSSINVKNIINYKTELRGTKNTTSMEEVRKLHTKSNVMFYQQSAHRGKCRKMAGFTCLLIVTIITCNFPHFHYHNSILFATNAIDIII